MSVDLKVDWCSYQAAKWAVEHWHYSKTMPAGALAKFGVWEDDKFTGAVIFGHGATYDIGSPYGLKQQECIELVRVALRDHKRSVSEMVAKTLRLLKKQSPGLRLVVSYADQEQSHLGVIYQAMNWIYTGTGKGDFLVLLNGKWVHRRNAHSAIGTSRGLKRIPYTGRHKYLYPLDRAMRKQIAPLALPYPKRETSGPSVEGDTLPQAESDVRSIGAAPNSDLTVIIDG